MQQQIKPMKLFILIFITATLLMANEPTLSEKLKSHNLIVSEASLNKYSELISLIVDSEAMNDVEKQERINKLTLYSKEDITKLSNILNTVEQGKNQLDKISQEELKQLQIQESKELIEELAKSIKTSGESKPKLDSLLIGANKICYYLDNAKADEALVDKMLTIIDTILDDKNLPTKYLSRIHICAYRIYLNNDDNTTHLEQKYNHLKKAFEFRKQAEFSTNDLDIFTAKLLRHLSYVNVCRGDFKEAIKVFDEVVVFNKESKNFIMITKAHALIFQDRIKEAKALYKNAINDSNKDEIIEDIESDIKDFKKLNFPAEKIAHIEEILNLMKQTKEPK